MVHFLYSLQIIFILWKPEKPKQDRYNNAAKLSQRLSVIPIPFEFFYVCPSRERGNPAIQPENFKPDQSALKKS